MVIALTTLEFWEPFLQFNAIILKWLTSKCHHHSDRFSTRSDVKVCQLVCIIAAA